MNQSKACCRCKQIKNIVAFHKDKKNPDGLSYECKLCKRSRINKAAALKREENNARAALYRKHNKEAIAQRKSERQRLNPEYYVGDFHNRRFRRVGQPVYKVTANDIKHVLAKPCFYCGASETKRTLDHLIPITRGGHHSVGNLVAACRSCNASKNTKFVMEFRMYRKKRELAASGSSHPAS